MRRAIPFLAALCILLFAPPAPTHAQDSESPETLGGDWVGWAYLDDAGDLPLRLRIEADPEHEGILTARFDELVSGRYDLPVARVSWQAPRLVLLRERPEGLPIRLEGELIAEESPAAIRGTIDWAGYPGDFELTRAPERLSRMAPETFEDCQGSYRLRPGEGADGAPEERTLVVGSRFWGELLFTDVASGRSGTLFPVDRDSFFAGSAMYVADPVHARVRFVRDEEGEVSGMEWVEEGTGRLWTGERIAFVEEEVRVPASDGVTLAGTLIRPDVPGPLPAVVLLGGSSWRERGSVRPDATVFASFGMAVLIYDKRGYGESGGENGSGVDPTVPFARTADDALAAVTVLRQRDDVVASQVGLAGRSRGGWFAPLAASRVTPGRDDVAFLLLFVAPAVSPAEQETTRRLNELRDGGASEEARAAAAEALRLGWHYGESGAGWDDYAAARSAAVAAGVDEALLEAAEPAEADPDAWSWVRLNMAYDPVPALERVSVPVLALFGGADSNVTPEQNLGPMRAALERAGNDDVELVVVPDANHGLRVVQRGPDGSEVAPHRQVGFGDGGWSRVERWLTQRFDLWGGEGAGR
jgi:dienelactone hydrolase